jgi:PKD repeat protein
MLTVAVAATPASGSEPYIASASLSGDAVYMAPGPNETFSELEDLQLMSENGLLRLGSSRANGIGDFDGDGGLDYIMAVGRSFNHLVYVFPKTGPGNQFDIPVRVGSFSEGYGPAGMTVADFNGDKMLDFVVISSYISNSVLFLNTGAGQPGVFDFEPFILPGTCAPFSFGIDAADFNNDDLVDFIVASNSSYHPFKVNINLGNDENGVPVFESLPFSPPAGRNRGYYGIAAADFIKDADGNADLAVSNAGSLDIYQGDGSGSFTFFDSYLLPMQSSPLDNGDFDRDGHQDLIAGNIGNNFVNLVVLFGNGKGDFSYSVDDIYTRPGLMPRAAVTTLPYVFNKAPVAQLTPVTISVTVGETVQLDASGSFDEDGTIIGYQWDYGEGFEPSLALTTTADSGSGGNSGEAQSSYVYFDSGTYYVTLTVSDDQGATDTVQAEVNVKALPVSVYFSPSKLNLKSKGKWITATILVPPGYDARGINSDNLYLVVGDDTPPIPAHKVYLDKWYRKHHKKEYRRIRTLKAKVDRQDLITALNGATGNTTLKVAGEISTNKARLEFAGTGNIEAYEKENKKSFGSYLWKQILYFFSKGKSR